MKNEKLVEMVNDALCAVQDANNSADVAVKAISNAETCDVKSDFMVNVEEAIEKLEESLAELKKAKKLVGKMTEEQWGIGAMG